MAMSDVVECAGCGVEIDEPTEEMKIDGEWACHNCAYLETYGRGYFVEGDGDEIHRTDGTCAICLCGGDDIIEACVGDGFVQLCDSCAAGLFVLLGELVDNDG